MNVSDWLMAISGIATAVFTLGLLIVALLAWSAASATVQAAKTANQSADRAHEQARTDSIKQTRPYVFVEFLPSLAGIGHWDIKVTNSGRSSARDLTLSYDNWPDDLDDIATGLKTMMEAPRTMPPGCSLRACWSMSGNFDDGTSYAGLPNHGAVTVYYSSDDPAVTYGDVFSMQVMESGYAPVPESGTEPAKLDAKQFYRLGQTLIRRIGELGR